jgi:hypothetical protein
LNSLQQSKPNPAPLYPWWGCWGALAPEQRGKYNIPDNASGLQIAELFNQHSKNIWGDEPKLWFGSVVDAVAVQERLIPSVAMARAQVVAPRLYSIACRGHIRKPITEPDDAERPPLFLAAVDRRTPRTVC